MEGGGSGPTAWARHERHSAALDAPPRESLARLSSDLGFLFPVVGLKADPRDKVWVGLQADGLGFSPASRSLQRSSRPPTPRSAGPVGRAAGRPRRARRVSRDRDAAPAPSPAPPSRRPVLPATRTRDRPGARSRR